MKLYHGSTVIVDKPLVSYGRDNLDFGKGFYTTSMQSQAEKWVQRFISLGKKGIINIYNFDNTDIPDCRRTGLCLASNLWKNTAQHDRNHTDISTLCNYFFADLSDPLR